MRVMDEGDIVFPLCAFIKRKTTTSAKTRALLAGLAHQSRRSTKRQVFSQQPNIFLSSRDYISMQAKVYNQFSKTDG